MNFFPYIAITLYICRIIIKGNPKIEYEQNHIGTGNGRSLGVVRKHV